MFNDFHINCVHKFNIFLKLLINAIYRFDIHLFYLHLYPINALNVINESVTAYLVDKINCVIPKSYRCNKVQKLKGYCL